MFVDLHDNILKKGFSLIELVIVLAILTGTLLVILRVGNQTVQDMRLSRSKEKAIFFAEEAMEAAKSFRSQTQWGVDGVGQLAFSSPYYPDSSGGSWDLQSGAETIEGKYQRQITFERAYRDSSDDLVLTGGTEDTNTRKIKVDISWTENNRPWSVSLEAYLMNIHNN